jgi:PAS domain S-box-containing protein
MVVVDAERRVVNANRAAAAFSGQPVTDMVGLRPGSALGCLNALANPEGCGFGEACQTCGLRQAVLDTLHTGAGTESEEVTLPFQRLQGPDERHLLVSTASIETPAGQMVLVCLEDVTEQKRTERGIISLARLADENPHPLLRVTGDGVVAYANRPAQALLDMMGSRSGEPLAEPYRAYVLKALASGHRRDVEATFQDRTFVVTFAPIVETDYVNIYGRDITGGVAAVRALRASEERYRALVEQSATYTLTFQGGRVRYANPATARAFGYTLEELGAKPAFDFIYPEERGKAQKAIEQASLGETVEGVELRVVTKAGDTRWVQFSATRIDFEGQPAVLVNGVDVTQQKQLEQQLIQSEKLTALGELISGITHELNNPLTAVLGYAELAQELRVEGELAGYLGHIAEQAARASGIIGNLLVFARQKEPEREPVSLNGVAGSALDLRGYELRVSNIQVVTELDDGLPCVLGDFQQLVQVVLNLVNNAEYAIHKHRETGAITLRTTHFSRGGHPWTRLEVLDNGPGIAEQFLTRIFDPFFTTKRPGEGTGLGLSVSYGIVAAHQGLIYAENRPEGGARFVVELPAAEAAEPVTVAQPPTPTTKPARILILEDEQAVATMLAKFLTGDGHQVSVAEQGAEALARLREQPFDLVITDFKMPGMSGLEFYRSLSAAHPGLAHRVLFTTGDFLSLDTRRFLAEVGAPVLYKPFTLEQARATICSKLREEQP